MECPRCKLLAAKATQATTQAPTPVQKIHKKNFPKTRNYFSGKKLSEYLELEFFPALLVMMAILFCVLLGGTVVMFGGIFVVGLVMALFQPGTFWDAIGIIGLLAIIFFGMRGFYRFAKKLLNSN